MFGSFTQNEVEAVKRWIDALENPNPQIYWSFVGRAETLSNRALHEQDIRVDYPVLSPISMVDLPSEESPLSPTPLLYPHPTMNTPVTPDLSKLLPLWFNSPCVLESFVVEATLPYQHGWLAADRAQRARLSGSMLPGAQGRRDPKRGFSPRVWPRKGGDRELFWPERSQSGGISIQ